MSNQRIEKLEVLNPCIKLCKGLLGTHIIKYRRLDALDMYHESGDPDIEIWIPQTDRIFILMAECKKPIGGKLSDNQVIYKNKYKSFYNVRYVEITSDKQLKKEIMNYSHYKNEELKIFMEHIGN